MVVIAFRSGILEEKGGIVRRGGAGDDANHITAVNGLGRHLGVLGDGLAETARDGKRGDGLGVASLAVDKFSGVE